MATDCPSAITEIISIVTTSVPGIVTASQNVTTVLQSGIETFSRGSAIRIIGSIMFVIFATVISFLYLLGVTGLISWLLAAVLSVASIIFYYFSFSSTLAIASSYATTASDTTTAQVTAAADQVEILLFGLETDLTLPVEQALTFCFGA